jgi:ketoreductase RED2
MTVERADGKVAIVTGSGSGIGAAAARLFAEQGYRVVVNSVSSVEAGTALAQELPEAIYVQGDISDEADCLRLVDAATQRWGRLDVLVNNAATTKVIPHEDLHALTEDLFRRILDVNVIGTWLMSRAAVPALGADGGGSIVNVSSLAGVRPGGSSMAYSVSKAGVNHLTKLLAKVLAPDIRVNAVCPGLIATPWIDSDEWDARRAQVERAAPLRRLGTPEDIAKVCLFLVEAEYTTGALVLADGGLDL